jgi:hypothetical protein
MSTKPTTAITIAGMARRLTGNAMLRSFAEIDLGLAGASLATAAADYAIVF